jgi:anti-sigma B factor antagonist
MQVLAKPLSDTLILRVAEPRIDAASAIAFKDAVHEAAMIHAKPRIILDLGAVGFIDSSGLGAVVAVYKLLHPARALELARLGPSVERVFRLTRMDRVFVLHADLPEGGVDAH